MSLPDSPSIPMDAAEALIRFVVSAQLMLDPLTPEAMRLQVEPRLLETLPTLQALGVFELLAIRHPALQALVQDELSTRRQLLLQEVAA
ncbi:hypothetical protein SAMN05216570_1190 [Dyella sp. OK004]|uniref:hypothetical protein n=1 Tax=Dyella sp. OK004 TaxID=1855292 RepID=UPI0008E38494|nr:hypothetical protein [Dyella sp. OK004]SFR95396.1 hypothetical protein SAMN05216570_1190 [Dyella sp. OK004]